MTEHQVEIDAALANAAECELIGSLAAAPDKRKAYLDGSLQHARASTAGR